MIRRSASTCSASRARPSAASSRAAASAGAASSASATSTVRLPSIRSSPAGLPVIDGSPKTPSRSSRSWNASPSGSPNAPSCASWRSAPAGQRGADVERPLDGVLRRLVAQHRHRGVDVGDTARLHGHVEELAGDHLAAAAVEDVERRRDPVQRQAAAAEQLVGPAEQQVAEQDRRGGAVLLGVAAPAGRARCSAAKPRWVAGRPRRVSEASM